MALICAIDAIDQVQPCDTPQRDANDWSMALMGEQAPFLGLVFTLETHRDRWLASANPQDGGSQVQVASGGFCFSKMTPSCFLLPKGYGFVFSGPPALHFVCFVFGERGAWGGPSLGGKKL